MSYRLGILVSHPIQYLSPWFRYLAKRMDIEVFYAHRMDGNGQARAGFGVEFDWDIPLLEGYPYRWLRNVARHPEKNSFFRFDTPEIFGQIHDKYFDAFLVCGWHRKSYIQAIQACRQNDVPVLLRGDSKLGSERSRLNTFWKFLPFWFFLSRLDAHLYVGLRNKDYLQHYGVPEEKLFFCPHFVDDDFFSERVKKARLNGETSKIRSQYGIPPGAFVFLFVGKMIPKKRPADFIQAAAHLLRSVKDSEFYFLLVGDGPLRASLETLARPFRDRIHFAGFRNQQELPPHYGAGDALVLPSDGKETWGLVVNEAFACGIPAIVSDAAGCAPDLIEEGKTGYTFPVGDIGSLASAMLAFKKKCESEPDAVARSLRQKIDGYSIERATEGVEQALEAVTCKRSSPYQWEAQ